MSGIYDSNSKRGGGGGGGGGQPHSQGLSLSPAPRACLLSRVPCSGGAGETDPGNEVGGGWEIKADWIPQPRPPGNEVDRTQVSRV